MTNREPASCNQSADPLQDPVGGISCIRPIMKRKVIAPADTLEMVRLYETGLSMADVVKAMPGRWSSTHAHNQRAQCKRVLETADVRFRTPSEQGKISHQKKRRSPRRA